MKIEKNLAARQALPQAESMGNALDAAFHGLAFHRHCIGVVAILFSEHYYDKRYKIDSPSF